MNNLKYVEEITKVTEKIDATQAENIRAAAKLCAEAIGAGKLVHLFGSGHSVLPTQDMFP